MKWKRNIEEERQKKKKTKKKKAGKEFGLIKKKKKKCSFIAENAFPNFMNLKNENSLFQRHNK